jgi:hypothetical protein
MIQWMGVRRTLFFLGIFVLALAATVGLPVPAAHAAGGWTWQNPLPQGNTLNSVSFTDASTGWAVGDGGIMLKTADGGATDSVVFSAVPAGTNSMPVYRFRNLKTGTHFYTSSEVERQNIVDHLLFAYVQEPNAYTVDVASPYNNKPLYRFFNPKLGVHFYTASEVERQYVLTQLAFAYTPEPIAYYVCSTPVPGTFPVYRFRNRKLGVHFYTSSEVERQYILDNLLFAYEPEGPGGVGYYVAP